MEYFAFKLNLEPSVLDAYNYESQREHVVGIVIPEALKQIFHQFVAVDENKLRFLDHVDISSVEGSKEYKNMLNLNETMIKMYTEVIKNYNNGKGINYTPSYLEERDNLNGSIEKLVLEFPFLKGAFDLKDSIFPVDTFSKIKMAVTYIRKAKKIEHYVNNFPQNISNSEFIYDKKSERIFISIDNKAPDEAKDYANLLEEKINSFSSLTNIGRISINPIYEDFVFEGKYSEITIEIVYPNGDPARDRSKAIEEANAAKERRIFEASKEQKIDASKLSEYFKEDAEKGYVKGVTSRGRNIIKSLIKIVNF